ncbi:maleylacetate reductase [Gordonia sputi]|uniref:maleylacetate reductase n=1 Tax=Gordonia sputi TaxID=36823 RepID=UPI0020440CD1|nr:maleylacetate reductase [Gordonia sputi]MCM3895355.1 maleylacetate reductase [Gordonia sputi]
MTMKFVHVSNYQRVVFAPGDAARALSDEIDELGIRRAMLIASPSGPGDRLARSLPVALRHSEITMHVPVELAETARKRATVADVDAVVSVGGGSATGLAKAVALTTGLPIIAVPTTFAGSEATDMWGMTQDATKSTGVDPRVLPRAVIYDATLTASMPSDMAMASGLNALAHGVDSMWAPRSDPIDRALAEEAIRSLAGGLRDIVDDPGALSGREHTLYGAYLAAAAFASAGSGLHHKVCHVVGGMFNLPHAQTHAVVLPHVVALNAPADDAADTRIARALGSSTANDGLAHLYQRTAAPRCLAELGMPEAGIERATYAILDVMPAGNPVELTHDNLAALLRRAWKGTPIT